MLQLEECQVNLNDYVGLGLGIDDFIYPFFVLLM